MSESSSPPTSPGVLSTSPQPGSLSTSPPLSALPRQLSQETRPRTESDSRWRTSSFSQPGRVVVIAVDPSPNAKNAFDYYVQNVHKPDDLLVVTHIPEPPKLPNFTFRGGLKVPAEKWKEIMDEANSKVNKLESDYEDACIHNKLRYKVRGDSSPNAGQSICGIADQENADLILIGCRGLGAIRKAMLGSVSDYVVRHAKRPVLVIPTKK